MASHRPLFIPWLKEEISSGNCPGLHWINRKETQFCIPWKHGLRQDLSESDSKIFEAWAIASGHYKPGVDKKDASVWKRNFRCALNKKKSHIRLISDKSSESENPHKVYEFCVSPHNTSSVEADDEDNEHESRLSELSQVPLESCMGQLTVSDEVERHHMPLDYSNIQHTSPTLAISPSSILSPTGALASHSVPEEPVTEVDLNSVWNEISGFHLVERHHMPLDYSNIQHTSPTLAISPSSILSPTGALASHSVPEETVTAVDMNSVWNEMSGFHSDSKFETDFNISVFYRGREVKKGTITNPGGCRIFFNHPEPVSEHLQHLDTFSLPDTSVLTDDLQIRYTSRLLEKVYQGLILNVQHSCICGQRLGRCKVYWSLSSYPTNQLTQEIGKQESTKLFSFSRFISDLIAFQEGKQGPPDYSLWLCFGELWPDPEKRPWEKMLIMVQVTPVSCQKLYEMAVVLGASPLHTEKVSLQISDSLSSASFLSWLQEIEERMEIA